MITAPCRRSALWNDVRLDGTDFVLLCWNTPDFGFDAVKPGLLETRCGPHSPFRRGVSCRLVSGCKSALGSCALRFSVGVPLGRVRALLRLRDSSPDLLLLLRPLPRFPDLEADRPLRPLRQTLPTPYQTKSTSHLASFPIRYAHHVVSTLRAAQNRMGRIVNVHSHASRHASAPKDNVHSTNHGRRRKFFKRSNLTALDSYGVSAVCEWWMYSGLGRCPANSSCRSVGIDMGGSGIDGGMGDVEPVCTVSGRGPAGKLFGVEGGRLGCLPRSSGGSCAAGLNEFRRAAAG